MKTLHALFRSRRLWLAGLIAILASSILAAQSPAARITEAVDDASRTTLKGNVSAFTHAASDQGVASSSSTLSHVMVLLKRTDAQNAALKQLLAEQQQKSSANYHKWITPTQFGSLYGVADSDLSTVTSWLQSKGLTVSAIPANRSYIEVSGSTEALASAFHTSFHSYVLGSRTFIANSTEPTIPSALTAVVSGIGHLNNLKPLSHAVLGPRASFDTDLNRLVRASSSGSGIRADYTYAGSSANYLFVTPSDAATIYNTPNTTLNANYTSGTSYTGSGVKIGIAGDTDIDTTPIQTFRKLFLGETTGTAPTVVNVDGVSSSTGDDALEAYLDLETSGGLAPGASIYFYPSSDLYAGIVEAINANVVDILSVSFGECELGYTTSENAMIEGWWQQAAAQGIAVTVSSGDEGSAGCDSNSTETQALYGLAVNGIGSTPYNISVGGTSFALTSSNFATYVGSTNSSSKLYRTATEYIPEQPWNDAVESGTTYSTAIPYTGTSANIVAAGGGKSNCAVNTTSSSTTGSCTSGWTKPSWQSSVGTSYSVRLLPDVSLLADDGTNLATWAVCPYYSSSSETIDCTSINSITGVGGTSSSTPAFAGILALVQESQGGGRLGLVASNLYNIFKNSSSASSIFHDVTSGTISVPCKSGTTNCSKNSEGYYMLTGFDAGTGYDMATGLGSVNVANLITYWSSGLGSTTPTITVTPSSTSITTSEALNVTVAVTGSSNTPSGSVTLSGGGYTSSTVNLNDGSATFTIPAGSLSAGTDTLTASYSGDGIYADGSNTTSVTVTSASLTATTTTLTASPTAATLTVGSDESGTLSTSVVLTATISPTAATGTVTFYNNGSSLGTATVGSTTAGVATLTLTYLPIGSDVITATYSGDSSYASSDSSSSVTVTVSNSGSGGSSTATYISGTSTATVTPSGGYTGTVDFELETNSNYLYNYGCYDISSASVTGTSAVASTLTLYIMSESNSCSSTVATSGHTLHAFKKLSTSSFSKTSASSQSPNQKAGRILLGFAGLFGIGLIALRRRESMRWFCVLAIVVFGFAAGGCGGGGTSSSSTTTTKSFSLALSPSTVSISSGSSSSYTTGSYAATLYAYDSSNSNLYTSASLTITVK